MKKYILIAALFGFSSIAHAQALELDARWPFEGGKLTLIADEPIVVRGFEIKTQGPYLEQGRDAAPFGFFLTNGGNPGAGLDQVTMGALANVTLDGRTMVDITVAPRNVVCNNGDVELSVGRGAVPVGFPSSMCIPEPTSGALAAVGLLGVLGLRRQRSRTK